MSGTRKTKKIQKTMQTDFLLFYFLETVSNDDIEVLEDDGGESANVEGRDELDGGDGVAGGAR